MSQNGTEKPKANLFDIRNIIGALLGDSARAAAVVDSVDRTLARIRDRCASSCC